MQKKLMYILIGVAALLVVAIILLLVFMPKDHAAMPVESPPPTEATAAAPDEPQQPSEPGSPEAIVRYYFERWNAKDTQGMDAVRIEEDRGLYPYDDLKYEASIELKSVTMLTPEEVQARFSTDLYENPAGIAMVSADFAVHYNQEGQDAYLVESIEHEGYLFWMVQATEGGDWRIVQQGY